jgi:PilZ domain
VTVLPRIFDEPEQPVRSVLEWTMKHEGMLQGRELLPRGTRIDVSWNVMINHAGRRIPAEVVNVSAEGFRLRTARALETGAEVMLRFAKDAPVKAVIHWVAGREAGGVFVESIAL